jgi:hypothetical protein
VFDHGQGRDRCMQHVGAHMRPAWTSCNRSPHAPCMRCRSKGVKRGAGVTGCGGTASAMPAPCLIDRASTDQFKGCSCRPQAATSHRLGSCSVGLLARPVQPDYGSISSAQTAHKDPNSDLVSLEGVERSPEAVENCLTFLSPTPSAPLRWHHATIDNQTSINPRTRTNSTSSINTRFLEQ